jgi:single-strand DNA-binding protein
MIPVDIKYSGLPKPPACLRNSQLEEIPHGSFIAVAGLVLVRQRPGTGNGVVFLTLEDETGVANIIIWKDIFKQFRRVVVASRLIRVTGNIQRQGSVCHIIAKHLEDISYMLDEILN